MPRSPRSKHHPEAMRKNSDISAEDDELASMLNRRLVLSETSTMNALFTFEPTREVVDAKRAKELLHQAHVHGDEPLYYEKVSLRGKSYTEEGAKVMAKFLTQFQKGLKVVDLADIIAGRPEDEALRVLTLLCKALVGHELEEIDLSDNALGEKGVRACFDLLIPQPTLRRLLFCNNGISAAAAQVISQEIVLQNGQEGLSSIEEFHFYNNMSGHDGCLAVANMLEKCPKLSLLRYASARAGPDASEELAKNIASHLQNLTSLDLSDCTFEDEGATHLAYAIGKQTQLINLKLRDASLGAEGALKVMQALHDNGIQLQQLDLSGNELEDDGLIGILNLIAESQPLLQVLRLDENEITSDGVLSLAEAIADAEVLSQLEELSLVGNEITSRGACGLVRMALRHKPALNRLELDTNMIAASGIERITSMLEDANKADALGSMQDNDEDEDDDDDDDDDDE